MSDHVKGARSATTAFLLRHALTLAALLLAPGSVAQEPEPTEPYRFFGGDVDRTGKDARVEACEYRMLVEEQRCNKALNKTTCISRVHEACLADPESKATENPSGTRDRGGDRTATVTEPYSRKRSLTTRGSAAGREE